MVPADMREWEAPEQADILVSELLGSFGDNELSPGGSVTCSTTNSCRVGLVASAVQNDLRYAAWTTKVSLPHIRPSPLFSPT